MQLSKFADFGLRVLMYLAVHEGERHSTAEIARTFEVSEHHLAKVVTRLAQGGFVLSGRGRQGGITLAQTPEAVTVGAVIRYLTADAAVVECFTPGSSSCKIMPACGLRSPLAEAQEAFYAALDKYTLEQVVARKSGIRALLEA